MISKLSTTFCDSFLFDKYIYQIGVNMFLDNKYTKLYYIIINHALQHPYDGYVEKHHIIPKSLHGTNHHDNIVLLSARQHYICHHLLTKMVIGNAKYKMIEAFAIFSNNTQRQLSFTSRQVESIREANSVAASIRNKGNQNWKKRPPASSEYCKLKSLDSQQRKWINDGITERFTQNYQYYIDNGYSYGRLPLSEEWRNNISINSPSKGTTRSQSFKDNIREKNTGRKFTQEHKQNLKLSSKTRPRVTCEHCGLQMITANYTKWHGDKCKKKEH